ncbi:hypothetical protein [Lapillicoccus jejuensis]|uniref:Integral membrane protein n=1 Tax=Lapillicoccus jejuensis TaxID=402171 RepID=A0A542E2J2_9MICO|nr:hypothetical protein [Lapillicoccus jejuensis]TQJ09535.1 hypothetical protein FB458_2647 [Lapillicoccus jejuensis]
MASSSPSTVLRARPVVPGAPPRPAATGAAAAASDGRRARYGARARRVTHAAGAPLATLLLSCAVTATTLRLWDWRPGTPVDLSGDALVYQSQVRAVLDGGAWGLDPHVGAPYGQVAGFFATADDLHLVLVRLLGLLSGSPTTVAALYFVLGFPASALTAHWLARRLGAHPAAAVVVGVLFSVVPAHQTRFAHLFLAAYWAVPLGMWLVVTTARGGPVLRSPRRPTPRLRRAAQWWDARSLLLVVTVGLTGVYYAAFTALLLLVALVVRRLRRPGLGPLLRAAVPLALLLATTGGSLLRSRWTTRGQTVTGGLAERTVGDSEQFAGKLTDLVLPWSGHRDAALAALTTRYQELGLPATSESSAIGVVALLGCVGLLVLLARAAVGRTGRRAAPLVTVLGLLLPAALAFYVRGGLGSLVALLVTPQLRTWSRLSLLVALLGLLAVGLGLTALLRRRRLVGAVACAVVLAVGVADQTNPALAPDWAAQRAALATLTSYTDRLEAALPAGCAVFEAPVMRYPENGPLQRMGDYDPLRPTLTGRSLRWSYGAMRGTAAADWQLALPQGDLPSLVDDLAAAGFCAVQVDHAGYGADDPTSALRTLLGGPLATSDDGRLTAFPLRSRYDALLARDGARALAARRDAVLHPVVVDLTDGASATSGRGGERYQWVDDGTDLVVGNLTGRPQEVTLVLRFTGVDARPRTVDLPGSAPTGATGGSVLLRARVTATGGVTHVPVRVTGPDATGPDGHRVTGRLQVVRAVVADPAVRVGVTQRTTTEPATEPATEPGA